MRKFGDDHYLTTQSLKLFISFYIPTPTPAKTPADSFTPTPTPASRASSAPASGKEEDGCMVRIIYMDLENKKMALAEIPRKGPFGSGVILLREDWVSPFLPAY